MNLFRKNIRNLKQRDGVTLVEVLTSITVAVIGVAGVLILIPFATRQAKVGLALEDSVTIAANAEARFQIEGYNRVLKIDGEDALPWILAPRQPNLPYTDLAAAGDPPYFVSNNPLVRLNDFRALVPNPATPVAPSFYFIDPLWVNRQTDSTLSEADQFNRYNSMFRYATPHRNTGMFRTIQPFGPAGNIDFSDINTGIFRTGNLGAGIPPFLPMFASLIDTANPFDTSFLLPPTAPSPPIFVPNVISQAIATRMFVSNDNLQFATETDQSGVAIDKLAPPQPYFDQLFNGLDDDGDLVIDEFDETVLRRQSLGDITWSAIAVPRRIAGDVDLFNSASNGLVPDGFDFYVLVYQDRSFEDPSNVINDETDPRMLFANVHAPVVGAINDTNPNEFLEANGAQISLNVGGEIDVRNDEWIMLINYDLNGVAQLGFFRVIGVIQPTNTTNQLPRLLLDGPEFTLLDTVEMPADSGTYVVNRTATYAVYLRDVVNVYKRQIRIDNSE